MNNRKLIILSGTGDPENETYKKVYNVIVEHANKLNYREIFIQGWKGQGSFIEKGFLNMNDATESAILLFEKIERDSDEYDVICRSFGTGVFLNLCQKVVLKKIGFVSLWGMPTYSIMYEILKEKIQETIYNARNKGVNIDETCFESIIPFDSLLYRFNQNFRVNIINGSEDIYSPPAFNQFLKSSTNNKNFYFTLIPGLAHEVEEFHAEYLKTLFSR